MAKRRSKYGRRVTGGQHRTVWNNREKAYRALVRKGMPKGRAAAIANAGHTKAGRKKMAKKAARTRRRR